MASDGVTNWKQVSPESRKKIGPIVKHYMNDPHPFTACVRDNRKRFPEPGRAEKICAVVKDMGMRTTKWRKGDKVQESAFDTDAYIADVFDTEWAPILEAEAVTVDELADWSQMAADAGLVESPLAIDVELGDLSLVETSVGQSLSARARASAGANPARPPAKVKAITGNSTPRRTRSGGSGSYDERKHPRGRGGSWTIKSGASGEDVRTIQRNVGAKADGSFGERTKQKVMDFQRKHGLQVDGIVGHQTATALAGHFDAARAAKVGGLKDSDRQKLATLRKPAKVRESAALAIEVELGDLALTESFEEGKHPRGRGGKFAHKTASQTAGHLANILDLMGDHNRGGEARLASRELAAHRTPDAHERTVGKLEGMRSALSKNTANAAGRDMALGKLDATVAHARKPGQPEHPAKSSATPSRVGKPPMTDAEKLADLKRQQAAAPGSQRHTTTWDLRAAQIKSLEAKVGKGKMPKLRESALNLEVELGVALRESGALGLVLDDDLRAVVDVGELHESFDLVIVEESAHGAVAVDLALLEADMPGDRLFNADGTIDFVIVRPCNGRGVGNRIYEADVLERDAGIFAGWPVYDNHDSPEAARARRGIPRPPSQLAGEIRESWWDPTFMTPKDDEAGFGVGGVIGRFMLTEDMEKLVRRLPRRVKTSMNATATGMHIGRRNGQRGMIVEGILNDPVKSSVDLVTKAGAGGEVAALYRELATA